ncbi:hypothetical protein L0U85_12180 [Glycomyces sp. L485]|uniref:hypothetical protein n=1 Tax=Glycomyces sp. L485 TaxID=2909235 RepID=UPI001F4AD879|nr:hypothetical protein [Glycomyces sp. L485]MCH7231602.1 hypothetical protein [Glycomyces sp. L485]
MSAESEEPQPAHRLGGFRFANSLTFTVYGDDEHDPNSVRVMLDDGSQEPYRILTVEGLGRLFPPPESKWLEGWIDAGDCWARIIYSNTISIVRKARSRQGRPGAH